MSVLRHSGLVRNYLPPLVDPREPESVARGFKLRTAARRVLRSLTRPVLCLDEPVSRRPIRRYPGIW